MEDRTMYITLEVSLRVPVSASIDEDYYGQARGLRLADGRVLCPFVGFEDDSDGTCYSTDRERANVDIEIVTYLRSDITERKTDVYPTIAWIKRQLQYDLYAARRVEILEAYVVGSVARKTAGLESDLDIAIVIPKKRVKSSRRYSEEYHSRFTHNNQKPYWQGRRLDYQFYYSGELPSSYAKITLE